jgi:hypothetical protein
VMRQKHPNIAELRAHDVLPRQPLDIFVIGAEPSNWARAYAEEVLAEIRPLLEKQAIFVKAHFFTWDVTDALSNTDLIRRMTLASVDYPKRLLVVANFNAFHASGEHSVAVWIEPDMNRAIGDGGLLRWLRGMVKGVWRLFAQERSKAGNTDGCGILTGPMFSHLLGNLVLRELDEECSKSLPARYFRYVDDITLVGDADAVARSQDILHESSR